MCRQQTLDTLYPRGTRKRRWAQHPERDRLERVPIHAGGCAVQLEFPPKRPGDQPYRSWRRCTGLRKRRTGLRKCHQPSQWCRCGCSRTRLIRSQQGRSR
eukprot:1179741-Rhodomonas_salina.1